MELMKVIESPEFEYLLYIVNRIKDIKKLNSLIIDNRDFKLGKILSIERYEEYSYSYHTQIESLTKNFNSLDIYNIDVEDLNRLRESTQSLIDFISQLIEELGIDKYDDLPF